nr:putative glucuronoxylan glucuronosyltransferase f8h [Ipomoea batatas]
MVSDWTKADPDVFTTNTSKPGWCNVDPVEAKRMSHTHTDWFGADCSAPSVLYSIGDWPKWLRPAKVNILLLKLLVNIDAEVEKRGPLIHVYDLPPEYNSLLLEEDGTQIKQIQYEFGDAIAWYEATGGLKKGRVFFIWIRYPTLFLPGCEAKEVKL